MSNQQWAMALDTYTIQNTRPYALAEGLLDHFGRHRDTIELCTRAVVLNPYTEQLHICPYPCPDGRRFLNESYAHYILSRICCSEISAYRPLKILKRYTKSFA
jgi:hypothetical protein